MSKTSVLSIHWALTYLQAGLIHGSSVKEIKLDNNSISDPLELSFVLMIIFLVLDWNLSTPSRKIEMLRLIWIIIMETEHRFELKTTDCLTVFSLLSKLCKSKATGLDKISAQLLRECADLVASSLCSIFNRSIVSGVFPLEWKSTKVIPLFKQGELWKTGKQGELKQLPPNFYNSCCG